MRARVIIRAQRCTPVVSLVLHQSRCPLSVTSFWAVEATRIILFFVFAVKNSLLAYHTYTPTERGQTQNERQPSCRSSRHTSCAHFIRVFARPTGLYALCDPCETNRQRCRWDRRREREDDRCSHGRSHSSRSRNVQREGRPACHNSTDIRTSVAIVEPSPIQRCKSNCTHCRHQRKFGTTRPWGILCRRRRSFP